MPTMPARSPTGQPTRARAWFASPAGQAVLASESEAIRSALAERPGQPWLWLAMAMPPGGGEGRGLVLQSEPGGWRGPLRCALPLPLANESVAAVVLQHVTGSGRGAALLEECARVLVPGGRLSLFALNPLSPYQVRWLGSRPGASEPSLWRRRLRAAGLHPEGGSHGLGPRWRVGVDPVLQEGPGLRAAWLLRAEKRIAPLTPVRLRPRPRLSEGVPVA
jgi:SAM-dependent methyltransferase